MKHLRSTPVPELSAGLIELPLFIFQQALPGSSPFGIVRRIDFLLEALLGRGPVIDLPEPILNCFNYRVKFRLDDRGKRAGKKFHRIPEFLFADAELVQCRLISIIGGKGAISPVRGKHGVERGYNPRFGGELVLVKRAPFGEIGFFAPT